MPSGEFPSSAAEILKLDPHFPDAPIAVGPSNALRARLKQALKDQILLADPRATHDGVSRGGNGGGGGNIAAAEAAKEEADAAAEAIAMPGKKCRVVLVPKLHPRL